MARKQQFLSAEWTDRFRESYAKLQANEQKSVDHVCLAIIKGAVTPGMRRQPIGPEKYYNGARINGGDRIVHRITGGTVFFMDIVAHDQINEYGRR